MSSTTLPTRQQHSKHRHPAIKHTACILLLALASAASAAPPTSVGTTPASIAIPAVQNVDFGPEGCQWRLLNCSTTHTTTHELRSNKTTNEYEYWDFEGKRWTSTQPSACRLQPPTSPSTNNPQRHQQQQQEKSKFSNGSPVVSGNCKAKYCLINNLWMRGGQFYFLTDTMSVDVPANIKLSRLRHATSVTVKNATEFAANVDVVAVPGNTVVIDWVYMRHLGAIGHWLEFIFPLFSVLKLETQWIPRQTPDTVVVLGQRRRYMSDWMRTMLAVAMRVDVKQEGGNGTGELGRRGVLPKLLFQQEADDTYNQINSPLEGISSHQWVCFQRVIWVQDVLAGGTREPFSRADANEFRSAVYSTFDIPLQPSPLVTTPPTVNNTATVLSTEDSATCSSSTITNSNTNYSTSSTATNTATTTQQLPPLNIALLRKSSNRRILNEPSLINTLSQFGTVTVYEFTDTTPFSTQLTVMSKTQLLVSTHTSALANANLLPPGAIVLELLPRSWSWQSIDQAFLAYSWALGDIFHFAWRAVGNQTVFIHNDDRRKYSGWDTRCCSDVVSCFEALTQTDIEVDVHAVREMLAEKIALIVNKEWRHSGLYGWPDPD